MQHTSSQPGRCCPSAGLVQQLAYSDLLTLALLALILVLVLVTTDVLVALPQQHGLLHSLACVPVHRVGDDLP